jgi:hypothetical protein
LILSKYLTPSAHVLPRPRRSRFPKPAARQGPMGLYVLGLGIADAIFANALVFVYVAWLYVSG